MFKMLLYSMLKIKFQFSSTFFNQFLVCNKKSTYLCTRFERERMFIFKALENKKSDLSHNVHTTAGGVCLYRQIPTIKKLEQFLFEKKIKRIIYFGF